MVVTTARAMTKAARATVAGATRATATTAATAATAAAATAATMTPNGDKDNEDGPARVVAALLGPQTYGAPGGVAFDTVAHVFPPSLGVVGAGLAGPVGIGKDGGHDGGWLVWGWRGVWRCGLPGYKKQKRMRRKSCLWTGLIHHMYSRVGRTVQNQG